MAVSDLGPGLGLGFGPGGLGSGSWVLGSWSWSGLTLQHGGGDLVEGLVAELGGARTA